MYYISDFCHICLKYEKSLINVSQTEAAENAEIVSKLKQCVSEVEWTSNKQFYMCNMCLQKLNSAYDFKQQCIKSTDTISKYFGALKTVSEDELDKGKSNIAVSREDLCQELVNEFLAETKTTEPKPAVPEPNSPPKSGPEQQQKLITPLTKLIVTNTGQGPFQNFYLNLIPASMLSLTPSSGLKEGVQNMFLMGSTLTFPTIQNKPPPPPPPPPLALVENDINVSYILGNSESEELSVEVDPSVFDYGSDGESELQESASTTDNEKDWDEIISCSKIGQAGGMSDFEGSETTADKMNYVPILPKANVGKYGTEITNEEKMEFFNFGHFLTNPRIKTYNMNMQCDICSQCFDTIRSLRNHIKTTHDGNFPYKCSFCLAEFALLSHYESHMEKHSTTEYSDTLLGNSITLDNIKQQSSECFLNLENYEFQGCYKEYKCDLCGRKFTTSQGLIRHKVRRHDEQKVRTKYFVKGMKNAKCEICNRSFSTQSYLQLHLKLHNRKGEWKRKIYTKEEAIIETPSASAQEELIDTASKEETKIEAEQQEQQTEIEECADDQLSDADEDAVSIAEGDSNANENSSPEMPDSSSSVPAPAVVPVPEEEHRSIKIRINLKDIIKVKDDFKPIPFLTPIRQSQEPPEKEEDMEVVADKYNVDNSADANGEYDIVEHFKFANFDELQDDPHESSKLDTICFSEDNVQLQNQNAASVFKFEWVNGKPKCVYCQKMFGRKHDLKRHINNVHMKSIQYKCHICKRKFYEGFHLTRHLRGHYSCLACPQCNKKFCTITDIKNHLMVAHDGIGNVDCGVCNISFDDLMILKDHIEEHLKTIIYKCHICDEEYKECRDLTKHIVEHSGVYTCSQCNRNFCTEKELVSHLRIHSSEVSMRHKCEICQNTFKKKRYLYSHLKNCHSIEKQDAEILIDSVVCEYSNHL